MAKAEATTPTFWEEALRFLGVCVIVLAIMFISLTLGKVWYDGSTLDNVRSDASHAYNGLNYAEAREQDMQRQITRLTDAYNKDHPDAKIDQGGVSISTGSGYICSTNFCSLR